MPMGLSHGHQEKHGDQTETLDVEYMYSIPNTYSNVFMNWGGEWNLLFLYST